MNGVVGLMVIVFIAWCLCSKGGKPSRAVRAHVHATGDVRRAARHEGGHGAVGRHVGGRIGAARVNPDGSGWIEVHPRGGKDFTPAEHIAISLAGGMAEGASMYSRQCGGDKAQIDTVLNGVPRQNRAAVMSEARRLARSGLFWQGGTASNVARRLERDGHL